MTSHGNEEEQKVLLQTRVSECLAQSVREYSQEILGEENQSWAVRKILKDWAKEDTNITDHSLS